MLIIFVKRILKSSLTDSKNIKDTQNCLKATAVPRIFENQPSHMTRSGTVSRNDSASAANRSEAENKTIEQLKYVALTEDTISDILLLLSVLSFQSVGDHDPPTLPFF